MTDIFAQLAAPFPPDRVSWRVGSVKKDGTAAMALAYIDARDVMERLDAVCGPAGWERRHPHVDKTTTCEIAIWIEGRGWVVKSDGAGDTAVEAEKGSLSDSFKRAAVNWGVGRYLYDLPSPWVPIDQYKKITAEGETKLRKLLEGRLPPKVSVPGVVTGRELLDRQEQASGRKSSAQAKRDGDHDKYMNDIAKLDEAGIVDWTLNFDQYTADAPISWLDPLRDKLELRREEIMGERSVADEASNLDEAFRATMGSGSPAPVSGGRAPHQAPR